MVFKAINLILALLVVPNTASHVQKPISLRYKFPPGMSVRYRVTLRVEASVSGERVLPNDVIRRSGTNTLSVRRLDQNGSAVVVSSQSSSLVDSDPKFKPQIASDFTLSPLGEMSSIHMAPDAPQHPALKGVTNPNALSLMLVQFPNHPVKPGDMWTFKRENPVSKLPGMVVRARFVKYETVSGIQTALINQSYVIPMDIAMLTSAKPEKTGGMRLTGNISMQAATNFAPLLGRIERNVVVGHGRLKLSPVKPGTAKTITNILNMRTTVQRIN